MLKQYPINLPTITGENFLDEMQNRDTIMRKFFNEDMPSATKYINKVKQQIAASEQSFSSRNVSVLSETHG